MPEDQVLASPRSYDDSVKLYDEPHSPQALRKLFANYSELSRLKILSEVYMYSLWLQIKTMSKLEGVASILEIGPGHGFTKMIMRGLDYEYDTMDIQVDTEPEILADIRTFDPAQLKNRYDLVCAFQVLEHLPIEEFQPTLTKLTNMSSKYVFLSLPYYCRSLSFRATLPRVRSSLMRRFLPKSLFAILEKPWSFAVNRPYSRAPNRQYRDDFMKEFPFAVHHWEIGRAGVTVQSIVNKLDESGLELCRNFHSPIFPYHFFILCRKKSKGAMG